MGVHHHPSREAEWFIFVHDDPVHNLVAGAGVAQAADAPLLREGHVEGLGRERSGLRHAVETLRNIPEIGFCFFETADVVRHALLEKIIVAYGGAQSAT